MTLTAEENSFAMSLRSHISGNLIISIGPVIGLREILTLSSVSRSFEIELLCC